MGLSEVRFFHRRLLECDLHCARLVSEQHILRDQ